MDATRLRRPLSLLAYLIAEADRAHARDALADLFWPEAAAPDALRNLRQLLYRLRKLLPASEHQAPYILVDAQTIQFNVESAAEVDVITLRQLVASVRLHDHRRLAACPLCAPRLAAMIELYRGRFLEGWDFTGSVALEAWALMTQESLARSVHMALHALGERYVAHERAEAAQRCARRLLHFDPWDEVAERLLLRSMAALGHRNRALREYERFRHMLEDELHVPPEDETDALVSAIREGALDLDRGPRFPIPLPTAPLVGRERLLAELNRLLADREHRLLTLLGPGGSGKTRLALHVAETQAPDWRHGVALVPLAEVAVEQSQEVARVVAPVAEVIAAALGVPSGQGQAALTGLLAFLRGREMLVILDNFEHLLPAGSPLLRRILQHAPDVKILVTSQARLNLTEEWVIRVGGLALPPVSDAGEGAGLADAEAVALFVHHARRVNPHWDLTADNRRCVARICHLVEGLPLALELAAAWIRSTSACRIAEEIRTTIDFLRASTVHLPARHHSVGAAFAYAYGLLSKADRALFCRLGIFAGDFDLETAEKVADAGLPALARLLDRSLVRLSDADRWDLHPLLRRYSLEHLARDPEAFAATQSRHAVAYLGLLISSEGELWGSRPRVALDAIDVEWDNVQAAWTYALHRRHIDLVQCAAGPLARFIDFKGYFQKGVEVFGAATRAYASEPDLGDVTALMMANQAHFFMRQASYDVALRKAESAVTLARASDSPSSAVDDDTLAYAVALGLLVVGTVHRHTGESAAAQIALQEALTVARRHSLRRIEAEALRTLGAVLWRQSAYDIANAHYAAALALDRSLGDRRGEAWTLNGLGLIAENEGRYGDAITLYREALALVHEMGDPWGESIVLGNLGYIYARVGDAARALDYYQRDLAICRSLGDRRGESWTRGYLSLLAYQQGRHRTALRHARRALALARAVGHDDLVARALTHLGHAWVGMASLADGDDRELVAAYGEAGAAYREALALRRASGARALAMETLAGLCRIALERGALDEAFADAEKILTYLEEDTAGRADEYLRLYLVVYRVLAAVGDARAADVIRAAHTLLQERAANVGDATLRAAFLDQVAVHREIQALFVDQTIQ